MINLLAQSAAPATPGGSGASLQFIIMALMLGGFYFLLIAPQRKKQKETEKMLAALQTGDQVVTTGGIYGVITNVKDDRFVVRVAENTKIEVGKGYILSVVKADSEEKKSS
jgi:preprotein translocase subunit YajC